MPTLRSPLESAIQRDILRFLALKGIFAIRMNTQGVPLHNGSGKFRPAPTRGVSDVHAILQGGISCWIEVKRPGMKPTPDQQRFLDAVNAAGGVAFVATSTWDVEQRLFQVQGRT